MLPRRFQTGIVYEPYGSEQRADTVRTKVLYGGGHGHSIMLLLSVPSGRLPPCLIHLSIQCGDLVKSTAFYDAVLAPLGGRRIMEFGPVIGYGVDLPRSGLASIDQRRFPRVSTSISRQPTASWSTPSSPRPS